jgi:hypothetical protein
MSGQSDFMILLVFNIKGPMVRQKARRNGGVDMESDLNIIFAERSLLYLESVRMKSLQKEYLISDD